MFIFFLEEKNNKIKEITQVLPGRKLAAFEIFINKEQQKNNKETVINHPPLYFDIKNKDCKKVIRRKIIPAEELISGNNTIFIKPIKINQTEVCIQLSTPASKFKTELKFQKIKENEDKKSYYFYPRYLW